MTWSIIIVIKFIIIMIPSSSHGLSYSTFSNPWRHRGSGSHPALFDQGASRSLATTAKTATGRWSLRIGPDFSSKIWRFTDQSWWFDYAIYIYISMYGDLRISTLEICWWLDWFYGKFQSWNTMVFTTKILGETAATINGHLTVTKMWPR